MRQFVQSAAKVYKTPVKLQKILIIKFGSFCTAWVVLYGFAVACTMVPRTFTIVRHKYCFPCPAHTQSRSSATFVPSGRSQYEITPVSNICALQYLLGYLALQIQIALTSFISNSISDGYIHMFSNNRTLQYVL